MKKVFLDAGHGGKDSGALGHGLREKDIVLSVTFKVGDILKKHGIQLAYSRTTDEFIDLKERSNKANRENSDIFVSIHANSFTNSSASGIETYSYTTSKKGAKLSNDIYESIISNKVYTQKRGIKTANFSVLKNTKMPAALVELGFITNKNDADILKNNQDELAIAVSQGILKYLDIEYVGENEEIVDKIYRVQVGAFRNKENAENLASELKNRGYQTLIR